MRGRDAKTYYDSDNNWTTPTWVEITRIIDETITPAVNLATGGMRAEEYEDNQVASRKFEWNCTYRWLKRTEAADAVYGVLATAFAAGTPLYFLFVDGGSTEAVRGWKTPILIDQMPQKRDLGSLVEITVHGVGCLYNDAGTIRKPTVYTGTAATTTTTTTTTML